MLGEGLVKTRIYDSVQDYASVSAIWGKEARMEEVEVREGSCCIGDISDIGN